MKGRLTRISALAIIALFIASTLAVIPAARAGKPADSIWFENETFAFNTASTSVGYRWNVTVWLNMSTYVIYAWQVKVYYNSSWLNCTKGGYAGLLGVDAPKSEYFTGLSTTPVDPVFGVGNAMFGEALSGSITAPTACKRLFWAEFNITAAPDKYQTYPSGLNINNTDTYTSNYPAVYTTDNYDGSVSYEWSAPALPHMGFDITSFTHDRYTDLPHNFSKKVYIKSLDPAWHLSNASFRVNYNVGTTHAGLLEYLSYTPDGFWGSVVVTPGADYLDVVATNPSGNPSGNVLVLTIKFNITYNGVYPTVNTCSVNFTNVVLWDTTAQIGAGGLPAADVESDTVEGRLTLTLPYLSVVPASTVVGPGPVVGTTFSVDVNINNLDSHWNLVGIQFRLSYDPAYLMPITAVNGSYLWLYSKPPKQAAAPVGSLGLWSVSYFEPAGGGFPDNVLVGELILPNGTGWWNPQYPGAVPSSAGKGTIATITFEIIKQLYPQNITVPMEFVEHLMVDSVGNVIPDDVPFNGSVTITTSEPGRQIDLYDQYPAPYGGQGYNVPSDMFWPQKQVELYAYVTYNDWPMQQKLVGFEINDPSGNVWTKLSAVTDMYGIAHASFRLPWPCEDPESLFGIWKVTATVDVACIIINDTMQFKYDYQAHIFKVTIDPPLCGNDMNFNHGDQVIITIDYGTHAEQFYPELIVATLFDNVNVPVSIAMGTDTMGLGSPTWCRWANGSIQLTLYIPKFAVAGWATLRVDKYDKDPTEGGIPYCPEYVMDEAIYITPYFNALSLTAYNYEPYNDYKYTGHIEYLSRTWSGVVDIEDDITATASGGLPFETLPGPAFTYNYVWDINGTVVQTDMHVATSTYVFGPVCDPDTGDPLMDAGLYVITVTATDFMGHIATYYTNIFVVP